jgi:trigger factor
MHHIEEIKNQALDKHFKITIPATDIGQKYQDKIAEIKLTIQMPGFRPGKAPEALILKRFGNSIHDEIVRDAIEEIAKNTYKDLNLAASPMIDDLVTDKGQDVTFILKLELYPEISIPKFQDIYLEKPEFEVLDKDIKNEIEHLIAKATTYNKKEGSITLQDAIEINLTGKTSDGQKFPAEEIKEALYIPSKTPFLFHDLVGRDLFAQSLNEQIVGKKVADELTLSLDYPKDADDSMISGKKVDYKVQVIGVYSMNEPELDDKLAKKFGHETLDALKQNIIKEVTSFYQDQVYDLLKIRLFNNLEDMLAFDIPKSILEKETDSIFREIQSIASEDEDLKGKTQEELSDHAQKYAKRRLRIGMMLNNYAEINNIKVSDLDIRSAIIKKVKQLPDHLQQQALQWYNSDKRAVQSVFGQAFEYKVVEHILNNEIKPTPIKCSLDQIIKLVEAETEKNIL